MTPDQAKKILSSSNKRLVIMGRFNSSGPADVAHEGETFSGSSGVDHPKLSVEEFFERMRPEVRYVPGEPHTVGDTSFNSFSLQAPSAGGEVGYGQLISAESPLLKQRSSDDSVPEAVRFQNDGASHVEKLIEDLDEVVKFSDGKFTAALLKLTRRYMVDHANSQSADDKVDLVQWRRLAFDHACSSAIANYMTCCRADEANARSEVSRALDAHAQGEEAPLTPQRKQRLLDGLAHCKLVCEEGRKDDDRLAELGKETEFAFLADYPGSKKYGLYIDGVGDKSFLEYYRYFLERSGAVHRFVRNGSSHSSVFLWLAGKYRAFESDNALANYTAESMCTVGVENQEERMPGQTKEERKRNDELVRGMESKVASDIQAKIMGDAEQRGIYEKMRNALNEGILEALRPETAFRRDALYRRLRTLFVALGQMAGGKAGQILGQATDKAAELARVYRAAKNVGLKKGEVEQYQKAFDKLRTEKMAPFVDALKEEVAALDLSEDELSDAVCVAVVKRIAAETKTYFDESWLGDLDAIQEENALLGDIYDLRSKVDVERREDSSRGMPMTVLTSREVGILAPVEAREEDTKAYAKSVQEAAKASGLGAQAGPVSAPLAVPSTLLSSVKENAKGVLKNEQGQEIASLASDPERNLIKATLKEAVAGEELLGANVEIDFGEALSGVKLQEVKGLDLQPLVSSSEARGKQLESVSEKFGTYSKTQSLLRDKYVADSNAKGNTLFTRGVRALALGEYMAAAPPSESNLGVADLSNVLGVIMDIVEHIGDAKDAKLFKVGATLPEDVLKRINISLHLPVNSAAELGNILQYHYNQCQKLDSLATYLEELRQVRNLFEALEGTDAEITVYNCTLREHADEDLTAFSKDLCMVKEHPVVLYLSHQAAASESSFKALSNRVAEVLRDRAKDTNELQLPLVITPASASEAGIFPLVSPSTITLPGLAPLGSTAKGVLPATVSDLNPYLALAASLVVGNGKELGELGELTPRQRKGLKEAVCVTAQPNQSLSLLLSDAWLGLESPLLPLLCMVKWANICLLHGSQTTEELTRLVLKSCAVALRDASDANSSAYLGAAAFEGLGGRGLEEWVNYMPTVFADGSSEPMSSRSSSIAFNSGALGIKQKSGERNFGDVLFVTSLAGCLS